MFSLGEKVVDGVSEARASVDLRHACGGGLCCLRREGSPDPWKGGRIVPGQHRSGVLDWEFVVFRLPRAITPLARLYAHSREQSPHTRLCVECTCGVHFFFERL